MEEGGLGDVKIDNIRDSYSLTWDKPDNTNLAVRRRWRLLSGVKDVVTNL